MGLPCRFAICLLAAPLWHITAQPNPGNPLLNNKGVNDDHSSAAENSEIAAALDGRVSNADLGSPSPEDSYYTDDTGASSIPTEVHSIESHHFDPLAKDPRGAYRRAQAMGEGRLQIPPGVGNTLRSEQSWQSTAQVQGGPLYWVIPSATKQCADSTCKNFPPPPPANFRPLFKNLLAAALSVPGDYIHVEQIDNQPLLMEIRYPGVDAVQYPIQSARVYKVKAYGVNTALLHRTMLDLMDNFTSPLRRHPALGIYVLHSGIVTELRQPPNEPKKKTNFGKTIFILLGIAMLLTVLGACAAYFYKTKTRATIPPAPVVTPPVVPETTAPANFEHYPGAVATLCDRSVISDPVPAPPTGATVV